MYAVIKTGGKQYRVEKSDVIYVEKLDAQEGDEVKFDVMLVGKDEGAVIGKPLVAGASVTGSNLFAHAAMRVKRRGLDAHMRRAYQFIAGHVKAYGGARAVYKRMCFTVAARAQQSSADAERAENVGGERGASNCFSHGQRTARPDCG